MHCRFMLPLIVPEEQLHADYWRADIVLNDGLQLNSRKRRSYFPAVYILLLEQTGSLFTGG